LGQEHDVPEPRAPRPAAGGADREWPGPARRRRSAQKERARDAADPRPSGGDDPPGSDELTEPGVLHRHADARAPEDVTPPARQRARRARRRAPGRGEDPVAGGLAPGLSADT